MTARTPRTPRSRVLAVLARRGYDVAGDLYAQGLAVQAQPFGVRTLADTVVASAAIALSAGLDRRALQTLTESGVRA